MFRRHGRRIRPAYPDGSRPVREHSRGGTSRIDRDRTLALTLGVTPR